MKRGVRDGDDIAEAIGAELVARLAPEELPLFQSLTRNSAQPQGRRGAAAGDEMLGFGAVEAIALMTPFILEFSRAFWDTVVAQVGDGVAEEIVRHLPKRLRKKDQKAVADPEPPAALTAAQAQRVREMALRQAQKLQIPADQAGLLADAMVGVLMMPPA